MLCDGCVHANHLREARQGLRNSCPFCRQPTPATQAASDLVVMKRMEANDPVAIREVGLKYFVRYKNYSKALEYWNKAAGLGDVEAHYLLSNMYATGEGVVKDEKEAVRHSEVAAIAGHPRARYNLAVVDVQHGRFERAEKHLVIAASHGYEGSLDYLKTEFKNGFVGKEMFEAALCGYQAAIEATKSPQRKAAAEAEHL
jgi:TPR repeat protein